MSFPAFDMSPDQLANNDATWVGGKENQVYARFITEMVPDHYQSAQQNKPVYKSVQMVEIRQIGEKDTFKEPVNDLHKRRFPRAWEAFNSGNEQMQNGTPLAVLFPTQPEVVETMKGFYIFTIEALAEVPDSAGAKIPYLTTWKERASKYLESVEKGKGFHALERRAEDAELRAMEMEERIKALESALAKRKGKDPETPEQE
jgi:hypothetical protein